MSERAFTRRFRSETGESPAVWRSRARLLAAVPLLRATGTTGRAQTGPPGEAGTTTTASVSEVGGRIGYASPATFTAAFTRAFGVPPSRFARSPRRGGEKPH